MRLILFSLFFCMFTSVGAQDFQDTSDTEFSMQRFAWSTASIGTVSATSIYGLSKLWYSQENQGAFHLFNDAKNWMQMDKLGHSFSCYHVTRGLDALFSWTGLEKRKSLLLASGISFGYLTTIEILDGFSESWGFSLSDMGFNAIGVGLYVFQEHYFKSSSEMKNLFSDLLEAFDNTLEVAVRCTFKPKKRGPILPKFAPNEREELKRQAEEGLNNRIKTNSLSDSYEVYQKRLS